LNNTDKGTPKSSKRSLSGCHFFHHRYHMEWVGFEAESSRSEVGCLFPDPWHGQIDTGHCTF